MELKQVQKVKNAIFEFVNLLIYYLLIIVASEDDTCKPPVAGKASVSSPAVETEKVLIVTHAFQPNKV